RQSGASLARTEPTESPLMLLTFRTVVVAAALSLLALAGCSGEASDTSEAEGDQTADGRVGSHGMVLVGTPSGAYLSHVPLFPAPHDVQLLLSVKLDGGPLPATFSDRLYTFLPETLSLDALRLGRLGTMRGTVFAGSFEDGGRPIASHVTVTVT